MRSNPVAQRDQEDLTRHAWQLAPRRVKILAAAFAAVFLVGCFFVPLEYAAIYFFGGCIAIALAKYRITTSLVLRYGGGA